MYHFIGIKGSGMSGLACLMKQLGYEIEGSDYEKHYFTEEELKKNNIKIMPFDKNNIKNDMIIVKGNMFNEENEEVAEAKKLNLKIYTYQEMVAEITKKYDLIAISGCHGKTTTSSMLSHVIESNYLIGDGSGKINNSEYFVLEACEYKRHFLKYHPKCTIITNIDLDHVDYYKNIEDVISAYQSFIDNSSIVIGCGDNEYVKKLKGVNYLYGTKEENNFKAKNIKKSESGIAYDFYSGNDYVYHFELPFFGTHMVLNSLAVISLCFLEGFDLKKIEEKLKKFTGAKRRFKETKILDNVVIDDYAHHPNEIASVINAVKQKYPQKKIISVFEPHTYSRTKKFYREIANELKKCDYNYIMDIYPSREKQDDYPGITSEIILNEIKGEKIDNKDADKLLQYHNSVLIFMSPNDLSEFEKEYIDNYS